LRCLSDMGNKNNTRGEKHTTTTLYSPRYKQT
jgi:hypothetical protein